MSTNDEPPRPSWEDFLTLANLSFVTALVRRLGVRVHQDVEDLVQEILLAVQDGLPRYDPRLPARAWLTGLARHVVIDWRREGHHRHRPHPREEVEVLQGPSEDDPEALVAARQREAILERLMDQVDFESRVALLMQIEGMDVPAIAKQLGTTKSKIHWRLRVGRKQLEAAVRRERARRPEAWAAVFGVLPFDLGAFREVPDAPASVRDRILERLRQAPSRPAPNAHAPEAPPPARGLARRAAGEAVRQIPGAVAGGLVVFFLLHGAPGDVPHVPLASTFPSADRQLGPPLPPLPATSASVVPSSPADLPAEPPVVSSAVAPSGGPSADRPSPTAAAAVHEKWLIAAARRDLNSGHPLDALRWLDEHAARFPHGALAVDREQLRARALKEGASAP
jgi:RNA polymerase sigma-70 factor (ECF subfamily)